MNKRIAIHRLSANMRAGKFQEGKLTYKWRILLPLNLHNISKSNKMTSQQQQKEIVIVKNKAAYQIKIDEFAFSLTLRLILYLSFAFVVSLNSFFCLFLTPTFSLSIDI